MQQTLAPLFIEEQIEQTLFGTTDAEKSEINAKIDIVSKRIKSVTKINGIIVFDPIVKGENIWYNMDKCPDRYKALIEKSTEREYYYPIQYANIEFNTK